MVKVIYTVIMSFGVLREVFSDFFKKNIQVCRSSIQVYRAKNLQKNSWKIGFSFFLDFNKKNL